MWWQITHELTVSLRFALKAPAAFSGDSTNDVLSSDVCLPDY
jgi:hypothetical protein